MSSPKPRVLILPWLPQKPRISHEFIARFSSPSPILNSRFLSMILFLGATGYIGRAFAQALSERQQAFIPLSRKQVDYTGYDLLLQYLRERKPAFLINAADYSGKPNVDACEQARADT